MGGQRQHLKGAGIGGGIIQRLGSTQAALGGVECRFEFAAMPVPQRQVIEQVSVIAGLMIVRVDQFQCGA